MFVRVEPGTFSCRDVVEMSADPLLALLRGSDSGLLGGLGHLGLASLALLDGLDDADSDGLSHVADSEATEWSIVGERLYAHRLLGDHLDDSGITGLNILWVVFKLLAGTTVDLLEEIAELAGNV